MADVFISHAAADSHFYTVTQEVQAKASSAVSWCKHASDYAAEVGTKAWKYLIVPHDEVSESKRLSDYLRFEVKA